MTARKRRGVQVLAVAGIGVAALAFAWVEARMLAARGIDVSSMEILGGAATKALVAGVAPAIWWLVRRPASTAGPILLWVVLLLALGASGLVACPRCGSTSERLSWLDRYSHVTRHLAESAARLQAYM